MTAPTMYPAMRFEDAPRALEFLAAAFHFAPRERIDNPDGTIAHAEMTYGPSIFMLGTDRDDPFLGRTAGRNSLYVAVDDAETHCSHARAAGAEVVTEVHDTDYGSREYAARDFEGNLWTFGTYRPVADDSAGAA